MQPLRYLETGEYDYVLSVEIFADGTVETFRGSYVTSGTRRRSLTPWEADEIIAAAHQALLVPEVHLSSDAPPAHTCRLSLGAPPGTRQYQWYGALPQSLVRLAPLLKLLNRFLTEPPPKPRAAPRAGRGVAG